MGRSQQRRLDEAVRLFKKRHKQQRLKEEAEYRTKRLQQWYDTQETDSQFTKDQK